MPKGNRQKGIVSGGGCGKGGVGEGGYVQGQGVRPQHFFLLYPPQKIEIHCGVIPITPSQCSGIWPVDIYFCVDASMQRTINKKEKQSILLSFWVRWCVRHFILQFFSFL